MIGFHMQSAVQNWPNAVALLPAGTWCKSLNDQHLCRDLKAVNPGVKVAFRYEFNEHQHLQGDFHDLARDFFQRFIDGTFWEQQLYKYMDGIEEWNEYLANSQSAAEKAQWLAWCKAVNEVWTNEYRNKYPELSHIKLISCNTAIGNDIPVEFARVVQEHDGILSYHNYTNVYMKQVVDVDWEFYSGRWTTMDAAYKNAGVTVKWLFTEGGATIMGTFDGVHYAGVTEGWRHSKDYGGDIDAYVNGAIQYQLDKMTAWNAAHGNRCLGGVLFTSENNQGSVWKNFQLFEPEMVKIATKVAEYDGPIDPPPPPVTKPKSKTWMSLVWSKTVEYQEAHGVQLNAAAGLQKQIVEDFSIPAGMGVIVHNEMPFRDADGYYVIQTVESYDGQLRTVYVYQTGKPIWTFTRSDFQV